MLFSIITPSFRSSRWLKLCISSVADQGVQLEHIVQDSCSDDGTEDWLPWDSRVRAVIEKDQGMYDAVNRGLRRATGEIFAYINCDEQYLPGALAAVSNYFRQRSEVEVVFADAIVVNQHGEYVCHRKAIIPSRAHCQARGAVEVLTCAMFFRRSVIDRHGLWFNATLRYVGDTDWIVRLIEKGVRMGLLGRFTSVYTLTGTNMSFLPKARMENEVLLSTAPLLVRRCRPFIVARHRMRRLLAGHYRKVKPFNYSIYTEDSLSTRVTMRATNPTYRWKA